MNSNILKAKKKFIKHLQKKKSFKDAIKIKQIYIRGYWNWNIHNDTCAICRNYIFESSISSKNNQSNSVIGHCNHAFHYECISSWLHTKNNCPLCNRKWQYKKKNNKLNVDDIVYSSTSNTSEESMTND
jgi:RING-box protein 1